MSKSEQSSLVSFKTWLARRSQNASLQPIVRSAMSNHRQMQIPRCRNITSRLVCYTCRLLSFVQVLSRLARSNGSSRIQFESENSLLAPTQSETLFLLHMLRVCTYHHWFSPPDRRCSSPYHELPMPITKLRALLHFRMGSHVLPVEQGRFARPHIPRNLRRCTLCTTGAIGDERHFCFECPFLDGIRAQYADLYDSSGGAMRSFMWHKDQEDVSDCLTAILQLAET